MAKKTKTTAKPKQEPEFHWPRDERKVKFTCVRPTKDGGLQTTEHTIVLPTREHALIFGAFCASGGTPEGAFALADDQFDGADREYVERECGIENLFPMPDPE